jgi:rfaE bifunctional protein nucleotidyltransferase chain/domain
MRNFEDKILSRTQMVAERAKFKEQGRVVAFTNGCFDILHPGHVTYLQFARQQGDVLVLGMNSDASVKRNKGDNRPIVCEADRARVIAALECIDYVVLFDEDEPRELIAALLPDVLVKGEDWAHYVSGREEVEAAGGKVVLAKMVEGRSTTNVIDRVLEVYGKKEG